MKIIFKPKEFNNPQRAMHILSCKVKKGVTDKKKIDIPSYYAGLKGISEGFERQNKLQDFNNQAKYLAETLVNLKQGNLAGVLYSVLIKLNINNPKEVEDLSIKALAIAKRFNDPVHIMARANNLVKIYEFSEFGSQKHIKCLYTVKRSLNEICKDYNKSKSRFMTISTRMKPLENYEKMLSSIKIKIAEIIMHTDRNEAIKELNEAKSILEKYGDGPNTQKINNLLNKLKH